MSGNVESEYKGPIEIAVGEEFRPFTDSERIKEINKRFSYGDGGWDEYDYKLPILLEGREVLFNLRIEHAQIAMEPGFYTHYLVPFPEATHVAIQGEPGSPLRTTTPFTFEAYSQSDTEDFDLIVRWEDSDILCEGKIKDGGHLLFERYNGKNVEDYSIILPNDPEILKKTVVKFARRN